MYVIWNIILVLVNWARAVRRKFSSRVVRGREGEEEGREEERKGGKRKGESKTGIQCVCACD